MPLLRSSDQQAAAQSGNTVGVHYTQGVVHALEQPGPAELVPGQPHRYRGDQPDQLGGKGNLVTRCNACLD